MIFSIYIRKELLNRLRKHSKKTLKPMSAIITRLVTNYLEKEEKADERQG